VATEKEK